MQIKKFKLINDGYDGIKVTAADAIKVNNAVTIDTIERTRNLPVPLDIRGKVAGLTYFFLNLTRHWVAPFNNYFNQTTYDLLPITPEAEMKKGEEILRNLWNDTTVTGASINNGEIILTGKINVFGEKTMGLATPTISADDDFGFYEELKTRLDEIADDIAFLMDQKELTVDTTQMRYALPKIEGGDEMTEDQLADKMLEKLSDKGVVILASPNDMLAEKTKNKQIHESKSNVDGDNLQEGKDADDGKDNDKEKKEEKKEKGSSKSDDESEQKSEAIPAAESTLASEGDFPDLDADDPTERGSAIQKGQEGGDLSQYEHSENMGSESEPEPKEPWE